MTPVPPWITTNTLLGWAIKAKLNYIPTHCIYQHTASKIQYQCDQSFHIENTVDAEIYFILLFCKHSQVQPHTQETSRSNRPCCCDLCQDLHFLSLRVYRVDLRTLRICPRAGGRARRPFGNGTSATWRPFAIAEDEVVVTTDAGRSRGRGIVFNKHEKIRQVISS